MIGAINKLLEIPLRGKDGKMINMGTQTDLIDKKIAERLGDMAKDEKIPTLTMALKSFFYNIKANGPAIGFTWLVIGLVWTFALKPMVVNNVSDTAKIAVKPALDDLKIAVEGNTDAIESIKEGQTAQTKTLAFINDMMYNMDPKAYNKTKRQRKEKGLE